MKIKLYFLTLVIFLAIDSLWLGLVAPKFYQAQIGHLMAETANLLAASIFYLLFVGALVYFLVAPGIRGRATREVLLHGALFGLVTYATYDLTNLATLRDWPVLVTVVDRQRTISHRSGPYHHDLYPGRIPDCAAVGRGGGIIVRSRSIVGNIGASVQSIFGGNISLYTSLCERTREDAFNLMLSHAGQLGANAVVGVRYDATEISPGITEVLCYGTAVTVQPVS